MGRWPRLGKLISRSLWRTEHIDYRGHAHVQYRYIDCSIPAEESVKLICFYAAEANDQESKILAGVRIADLHAETFTNKEEKVVPCLKGRLIKGNWLKVNGRMVFKAGLVVEQATSAA